MSSTIRSSSFQGNITAKTASRFLGSQPSRPEPASSVSTALPLPSRFALAFLGIFYPRSGKTCIQSIFKSETDYGTANQAVDENDGAVRGHVRIDVEWLPLITYDESMKDDEDHHSLRSRLTGFSCSDVISLLYLFVSSCFMMFDFTSYVHAYWGIKKQTLHFVSYLSFLTQIMVVTYWCFFSRLTYHYQSINQHRHKVSTLSKGFIARRINIIREWRSDAKILSWFSLLCVLACPMTSGCLRIIYDYVFRICQSEKAHIEISHWTSFLGFFIYGCFCYIIYIERRSFEIETHQIYRYALEQAPFQNVDGVLNRIRHFNLQYRLLRKQIRKWMAFTMVVSTWGLTSHITWTYWVFSDADVKTDMLSTVYVLNALVTSQQVTFIVVPYMILGGLNIDHIWLRFKENIAHCREYKYVKYWEAVGSYVKDINVGFSGDLTPTLVSSAVGLYLGLNLTKTQNLGFWNGANGCNFTDHFFFD